MRRLGLIENLKNFIITKPPTVLFSICLLCFIIVLSSFMDYVSRNNVKNPDELDWNAFRGKMAELDFCFKYPSMDNELPKDLSDNIISKNNDKSKKKSYSYPATFIFHFNGNSSQLEKILYFSGKIDGFLIGLEKEKFDVNFEIGDYSILYDEECTKQLLLGKKCYKYSINGCLTLSGFSKFFKKTKSPNMCPKKNFNNKQFDESSTSTFLAYKETPDLPNQYWCPSDYGGKAKIDYKRDHKLIPLLTIADKELIRKNLMFIIIGLSALLTSMIVYAMFTTNRKKTSYFPQTTEM